MAAKDIIMKKKTKKSKCDKICRTNLLDYVLLIGINSVISSVNHTFRLYLRNLLCSSSSAIEIRTDPSSRKNINQPLWLEITCYDCVRMRDKLKDVVYSLLAQFDDGPTWATVMLRDFSNSNHKFCRLFFARIFANDWRKRLVFVSRSPCFDDQLLSCNFEVSMKYKTFTNGPDTKSPNCKLLLHPLDNHQGLNTKNGARKRKCHNSAYAKIDKAVNQVKRKRGKKEKKVSLDDINSYLSRSITLKEAAEGLGVSRSTLKRKCRQLGISQWQPSNGGKRFRRTPKCKKVSEFASLKSLSSALDGNVVSQYRSTSGTCKIVPEFTSQFEPASLKSISSGPDVASQTRSSRVTPKYHVFSSGLEVGTRNSISSMKDFSRYRSSCGTPKSKKVAEFGSSARDVSQYRHMNQNLPDHRSFIFFPFTYTPVWNRTEAGQLDSNLSRNTVIDERLAESNEKISVQSFTSGQISGVPSPLIQQVGAQEGMTSLIKATYKGDMVRFHFYFKANITEFKKEVARRLNLKLGTFKVKYLDDEDEWALLASDLDWQEFIHNSSSSRRNVVRLLIQDMRMEEEDKDDLQTTLLKL